MSYEQVKDLRPADFKRYCGVEPETATLTTKFQHAASLRKQAYNSSLLLSPVRFLSGEVPWYENAR